MHCSFNCNILTCTLLQCFFCSLPHSSSLSLFFLFLLIDLEQIPLSILWLADLLAYRLYNEKWQNTRSSYSPLFCNYIYIYNYIIIYSFCGLYHLCISDYHISFQDKLAPRNFFLFKYFICAEIQPTRNLLIRHSLWLRLNIYLRLYPFFESLFLSNLSVWPWRIYRQRPLLLPYDT